MSTPLDLINFVLNKDPIEFTNSFETIINDKIDTLLSDKKYEVAQSLFSDLTNSSED